MYHTCATYYRECRCYNSPLHCLCSSNRAVCKDLATVQWFLEYNQTGVSLWKPQFFRQKHHTDTTDLFCLHYWSKDFGHHYFIVSFLQLLNHWFNKIRWPSIPWKIIQVQTTESFHSDGRLISQKYLHDEGCMPQAYILACTGTSQNDIIRSFLHLEWGHYWLYQLAVYVRTS